MGPEAALWTGSGLLAYKNPTSLQALWADWRLINGDQDCYFPELATLIPAWGAFFYHHFFSLAQPQTLFVGP